MAPVLDLFNLTYLVCLFPIFFSFSFSFFFIYLYSYFFSLCFFFFFLYFSFSITAGRRAGYWNVQLIGANMKRQSIKKKVKHLITIPLRFFYVRSSIDVQLFFRTLDITIWSRKKYPSAYLRGPSNKMNKTWGFWKINWTKSIKKNDGYFSPIIWMSKPWRIFTFTM